jgi:hypothetical protein
MRMNRYFPIILIVLAGLCQCACAASLFYTGNIAIEHIEGRIVLGDTTGVSLSYLLNNRGSAEERVNLEYSALPVSLKADGSAVASPLVFGPGETKQLELTYSLELPDDVIMAFSLDPTLSFDGKANNAPVGDYHVAMTLPAGTESLLTEDPPHHFEELDNSGLSVYEWAYEATYPPVISVRWDTRGIDLLLTKSAVPTVIAPGKETLTVMVSVENHGSGTVRDVYLIDEFVPSDFAAVSPSDEFVMTDQNTSDIRLYWVGSLGDIAPGETGTANYQIRYTGDVQTIRTIELAPCMASVDDHLAGLSNPVTLTVMGDAVPVTTPVTEAPLPYPVLLTLAGCAAGCLLWRRYSSRG